MDTSKYTKEYWRSFVEKSQLALESSVDEYFPNWVKGLEDSLEKGGSYYSFVPIFPDNQYVGSIFDEVKERFNKIGINAALSPQGVIQIWPNLH